MDAMKGHQKKAYTTPALTVYGNVETITQGNSTGNYLDQSFPIGTHFKNLTFSN
jgi:hypothetical protein